MGRKKCRPRSNNSSPAAAPAASHASAATKAAASPANTAAEPNAPRTFEQPLVTSPVSPDGLGDISPESLNAPATVVGTVPTAEPEAPDAPAQVSSAGEHRVQVINR